MSMSLRIGFFVYSLVIIIVSLTPSGDLAAPGNLDKVGHFLAYAGMTVLGLYTFTFHRAATFVILFSLSLGIALEFLQYFVSGRSPSLLDTVANSVGVFAGAMAHYLIAKSKKE